MAKDNRVIKSSLRVAGKSYGPGQEDELAEVLSGEDGARHLDNGAIEGDWDFMGSAPVRKTEAVNVPGVLQSSDSDATTAALRAENAEWVAKFNAEADALETAETRIVELHDHLRDVTAERDRVKTELTTAKSSATRAQNDLNTTKAELAKVKAELEALKKANATPPANPQA